MASSLDENCPWLNIEELFKERKTTRTWYYDNGQKGIEIEFDGKYPMYFQCWHEDGTKKAEGRYKDFLVREPLRIWSKDGKRLDSESESEWNDSEIENYSDTLKSERVNKVKILPKTESESEWNPLVVGYIAFVIQLQPFSDV